tara:strand:+ start:250 stop:549 length:300 start_codon:yes stop_codon:yes gene_type:complete
MSKIKESYVYVESKSQDQTCIGIKGGKFAGVIYKYGSVSLGEETEDGNMPFKFEFDIVDNNAIPKEEFGEDFMNLIGDILVDIIEEQYAESDNRKDNSN